MDSLKGRKGIPAYYCQHYEPIFFFSPEEKDVVTRTYDLPLNLIANSPWLASQIKQKHKRESTVIVPGVDQDIFKQALDAKSYTDTPFKILAFASPTPFKGFYDTTLPALNYVWRALGKEKVEFHIYGKTDMPIPYDWGNAVLRHSNLDDVKLAALYNECDLYVGGSWAESSPLPPLEAMACGCPVVCTENGTEHYGTGIMRVKPRAPRELGAKILMLLAHPEMRSDMNSVARTDVQAFTWKRTVDEVETYFKTLLGEVS